MLHSHPCPELGAPSQAASRRPTLSAVARAAKVSLATASYALRNNPKIPQATRQHVCAIAKGLGYRPNPEVGRLMFLLRDQHRPAAHATIALLEPATTGGNRRPSFQAIEQGISDQCADLGYSLDRIAIDPAKMSARRITDILTNRGIKGAILGPSLGEIEVPVLLEDADLPVISMTRLAQIHHSGRMILPHHLQIAALALNRIREAGWQRIGWITEDRADQGEYFLYHTAVIMAQQAGHIAPIPALSYSDSRTATAWRQRHQPDAVLVPDERLAAKLEAEWSTTNQPALPLYVLDRTSLGRWPGVDQHALTIGQMAVELLARLIQTGAMDAPECVSVTMVEGSWRDSTARDHADSIRPNRPPPPKAKTA